MKTKNLVFLAKQEKVKNNPRREKRGESRRCRERRRWKRTGEERRSSYDADVAELVGGGHGVIVQQAGGGDPAGVRVVGEDDQLVLVALVADPEQALLHIRHDDALPDGVNARHQVRHMLQRLTTGWTLQVK